MNSASALKYFTKPDKYRERCYYIGVVRCSVFWSGSIKMRFFEVAVSEEGRYTLGEDCLNGGYYISIPVSNRMVDYEEYYRLYRLEFDKFRLDQNAAALFADKCRSRDQDDRLIIKPAIDRGVAS